MQKPAAETVWMTHRVTECNFLWIAQHPGSKCNYIALSLWLIWSALHIVLASYKKVHITSSGGALQNAMPAPGHTLNSAGAVAGIDTYQTLTLASNTCRKTDRLNTQMHWPTGLHMGTHPSLYILTYILKDQSPILQLAISHMFIVALLPTSRLRMRDNYVTVY